MKNLLYLLIIVILGLGLRLYHLGVRPIGFTWDEASLGYNAYSLLKTGKDEYGKTLPIVLKSFGDYKPGLYAYFTIPSVATLGLTEVATRLPSALFGTLLIIAVYVFTKKLPAALLMAINPWAIHFSRGGWESNLNLLLVVLGSLLFIRKRLILSGLIFGLTLLTYQGAKMFTPLILISLFVIYRPNLTSLRKPLLIFLLVISPILLGLRTQSGRLKVYSVFSYTRNAQTIATLLAEDGLTHKDYLYYLYHSEILDQLRGIFQRYTNHFSPKFLFFAGDWTNLRQSIPYYGYLHVPEIFTVVIGLYLLIKSSNRETKFIATWLLLAPLPSALSRDLVSGVRSLPMIFPLVIISGLGLERISHTKISTTVVAIIFIFFTALYLDLYHIHAPIFTAPDWLYGYKQAWKVVAAQQAHYKKIVFSDKLGQPYIFGLFYLKIDPRFAQSQLSLTENEVGDVGKIISLGKYSFRPVYWPSDRGLSSTLFVGNQYELPEQDLHSMDNLNRLAEINYPDGTRALRVVGLK